MRLAVRGRRELFSGATPVERESPVEMRQWVPDLRHLRDLSVSPEPHDPWIFQEMLIWMHHEAFGTLLAHQDGRGDQMPAYARSLGIVEEIRRGWGYDSDGRWHQRAAEVVPIRKASPVTENDPLAPVRGSLSGLLFSFLFFWFPVGVVTFLKRRK